MTAPNAYRREIVSRRCFTPAQTRILLACGHSVISYSGRPKQKNMRCDQCAAADQVLA